MAVSMVTRSLCSCLFSWYINTQDNMLVMESVREGKEGGKEGRGGEQEIVPDLSESVFCL